MTYQVLARKWRPRDFPSLVGQDHVVRALTHALDQKRLHHAYLFTGTRGVGKTTLSRILAKALNCETGITSQPCGVCRACTEIDAGRFVDYVEMDAASNRGVDEMAALLERAIYAPVDARFKVYMIDEVHMLTNHAFNAMLKTLEEPPAHVKFILATTDPQKIPVTVLSRCLQFNLKQMPAHDIVDHLGRVLGDEQIAFEPQALRLLARAADGSMRDALSLTDQAIAYAAGTVSDEAVRGMLGALDQHYLVRLLEGLIANDGPAVLAVADDMAARSLSFSTALQDLAQWLNRIGWAQSAPGSVLAEWPEADDIRRFAQSLGAEQIQLYYQIATIGRSEMGLAPDEYAGFTMTLLRMLAFRPVSGLPFGGGASPASAGPVAGSGSGGGAVRRAAEPSTAPLASVAPAGAAHAPTGAPRAAATSTSAPALSAAPARVAAPTPSSVASAPAAAKPLAAAPADHSAIDAQMDRTPVVAEHAAPAKPTPVAPQVSLDDEDDAAATMRAFGDVVVADKPSTATAETKPAADAPRVVEALDTPGIPVASTPGVDVSTSAGSDAEASDVDAMTVVAASHQAAPLAAPPSTSATSSTEASSNIASPRAAESASAEARAPTEDSVSLSSASASPIATTAADDVTASPASGARAALAALGVLRRSPSTAAPTGRRPSPSAAASAKTPPASPASSVPSARNAGSPTPDGAPTNGTAHARANGVSGGGRSSGSPAPWEEQQDADSAAADAFLASMGSGPSLLVTDEAPRHASPSAQGEAARGSRSRTQGESAGASSALNTAEVAPPAPGIPMSAVGVASDWPAFAMTLDVKGLAQQLAHQSELIALDQDGLQLRVPVATLASGAHVEKVRAAILERLGRDVQLQVNVGPAQCTAAAVYAAERAALQRRAEASIRDDAFVRALIDDFGASILPGATRPLSAR